MTPLPEIKRVWELIQIRPDAVFEIRALCPKGIGLPRRSISLTFRTNGSKTVDAVKSKFEAEALRLNALGYNIYTVMNPIKHDFAQRTAKDQDIACRSWMLIDIDRAGDTSGPASDEEVDAARLMADAVAAYLAELGWSEPVRVMSGNGHHLYYRLGDLPNDAHSTQLVSAILNRLAQQFNNDRVKIDTAVYNASRITKVPGTVARKGVESEGRPYRMAVVL